MWNFGILFIPTRVNSKKKRHKKAIEILGAMRKEFPEINLQGIEFIHGDVSKYEIKATHIFCYDYIFSQETHEAIFPNIEKSNFSIFVCFSAPKKMESFGCKQFELIHKMQLPTTGGQSFTAYFYRKQQDLL